MRVICPLCKGLFCLDHRYQRYDGKCSLCNDNKFVDTELICECGRPVSRIVNEMMICNFLMCEKRATEKKEPPKPLIAGDDDIYGGMIV